MSGHVHGVTAVVLAGGAGTRAGGVDKGWCRIDGEPAIERVVRAIAPQVQRVWISANRHLDDYRRLGLPVLVDDDVGFAGPLAGIARALRELESGWLATVPVDALPCPRDWVARLLALPADDHPRIRVAHDGVRRQALFALYPHVVAAPIRACYLSGVRAVWRAQDACGCVELRFAEGEGAFGNRNEC